MLEVSGVMSVVVPKVSLNPKLFRVSGLAIVFQFDVVERVPSGGARHRTTSEGVAELAEAGTEPNPIRTKVLFASA